MLRRSRADLPVVLASWALLASALSLLAAGTLYTDAVTLAGLHRELLSAPAADRAIVVRTKILPDRLAAADAAVVPELRQALASTGGEVAEVLHSSAYADAAGDPETLTDLTQLASFQGIEDHADARRRALGDARADPIEATVSEGAAAALGVRTGDTLSLVSRLDANRRVDVAITGTWRADPADGYWLADPLGDRGQRDKGGRFTTRGPLVVAEADLTSRRPRASRSTRSGARSPTSTASAGVARRGRGRTCAGWLGRVNAATAGHEPGLRRHEAARHPRLGRSLGARRPGGDPAAARPVRRARGVRGDPRRGAAARAASERDRAAAVARRGHGHLAAMAFGEALIVVVPAVIVAPWLAMLLVQAVRLNPAMEGVGLTAPLPGPATFATADRSAASSR